MAKAVLALAGLLGVGAPAPASFDLAIRHARVVHGDGRVTPSATVLIVSGRVARIDESAAADGVPARRTIEATGLTVLPGLIDAHVRLQRQEQLVQNGVTTVRDLRTAIDGSGSTWAGATIVDDFTSTRAAVRRLADDGADVIAVGPRLASPLVAIVVQEAAARGVPVAANLGAATALEAATYGVTSIEGLSGIAEAANPTDRGPHEAERAWTTAPREGLDRVARALADRGVTLVPILVRQEARATETIPPADATAALRAQQRFVKDYAALGGRIVAGTDAGNPPVLASVSLVRELELYVEAGLTPAAALKTATADAAVLLGIANRVGTIAIGKDADLILVDGDPLRDITALRRIVNVVRRGVVVR